jgi:hypothetical protein
MLVWVLCISVTLVAAGTASMFYAVYRFGTGGDVRAAAIGFILVAFLMLIQIFCLGAVVGSLARIRDALSRRTWW